MIILLILVTFLLYYKLKLLGENWIWSLLGLKGLTQAGKIILAVGKTFCQFRWLPYGWSLVI